MRAVPVIFSRSRSLGSLLLRGFLWSRWSHCGIVDGDRVVEAVSGRGVIVTPLVEFKARASDWEILDVPTDQPDAVLRAAYRQIGKPYDWAGVMGFAFRRCWQDDDSWFCSELIAWAFAKAGANLFRTDVWRITPRDLNIRKYI